MEIEDRSRYKSVKVGGRLLIYIKEMDILDGEEIISLAEQGTKERGQLGFNRFRLVLAIEAPSSIRDEVKNEAENIFNSIRKDEKVHLHVVHGKDLPQMTAITKSRTN